MNIKENDQLDIYFDPNFGNLFVNDQYYKLFSVINLDYS